MSPGSDPLTDGAQPSPVWQQVQTLGVAEIAVTILNARKTMPGATAAAVSREKHGGGFRIRVSLRGDAPSPDDGNPQDQRSGEEEIAITLHRAGFKGKRNMWKLRDIMGRDRLLEWRFHNVDLFAVRAREVTDALLDAAGRGITLFESA